MKARAALGAVQALAVAAAGAGLVWGAGQVEAGVDVSQGADRPRVASAPAAASRAELVCPGPDRPGVAGVPDSDQTVTPITASAPTTALPRPVGGTSSSRATVLPSGADLPGVVRRRGTTSPIPMNGPRGLALTVQGALAPGFAAVQVGLERAASVRGATMVPCAAPVPTSYLLAGGREAGRSERLVLTNPAPNPVAVRVSVLGTGKSQEVVVPSLDRMVLVLGSIDDTAAAPIVKVTADRGTVAAVLVDAQFAGAVPRGTEVVGPAQPPSTTQLIPALIATAGGRTGLRVGVPGQADAVVRVALIAPDGTPRDELVTTVGAGTARTVALPTLPPGRYAVRVTADEPVVTAAASIAVADSKKPGDYLWMPSSAPVAGLAGSPVPRLPGGSAALVLGAPDAGRQVTVFTTDSAGTTGTRTVAVPAGQTRSVDLSTASSVWVRTGPGAPVTAALVVTGKDGAQPLLTGVPLTLVAESAGASSVRVSPVR